MNRRHLIDDLRFETHLDQAASAHSPGNDWPAFCRERLLPVVDRVFDEFSPDDGPVHRLELLEVDLGELPHTLSAQEIEQRLEHALRQQLTGCFIGALPRADTKGSALVKTITKADSEREILEHYLRNGFLPRNADTFRRYPLEEELTRLAGRDSEAVVALLADRRSLERIIRQLDDDALERLLRKLSTGSALDPDSDQPDETPTTTRVGAEETDPLDSRYATWENVFLNALTANTPDQAPLEEATDAMPSAGQNPNGSDVTQAAFPPSADTGTAIQRGGVRLPSAAEGSLRRQDASAPPVPAATDDNLGRGDYSTPDGMPYDAVESERTLTAAAAWTADAAPVRTASHTQRDTSPPVVETPLHRRSEATTSDARSGRPHTPADAQGSSVPERSHDPGASGPLSHGSKFSGETQATAIPEPSLTPDQLRAQPTERSHGGRPNGQPNRKESERPQKTDDKSALKAAAPRSFAQSMAPPVTAVATDAPAAADTPRPPPENASTQATSDIHRVAADGQSHIIPTAPSPASSNTSTRQAARDDVADTGRHSRGKSGSSEQPAITTGTQELLTAPPHTPATPDPAGASTGGESPAGTYASNNEDDRNASTVDIPEQTGRMAHQPATVAPGIAAPDASGIPSNEPHEHGAPAKRPRMDETNDSEAISRASNDRDTSDARVDAGFERPIPQNTEDTHSSDEPATAAPSRHRSPDAPRAEDLPGTATRRSPAEPETPAPDSDNAWNAVEPPEPATRDVAPSFAVTTASTRQSDEAARRDELTKHIATTESGESTGSPAADLGDTGTERIAGTRTTGNAHESRPTNSMPQAMAPNEYLGRDRAPSAAGDVSGTDARAAKTMPGETATPDATNRLDIPLDAATTQSFPSAGDNDLPESASKASTARSGHYRARNAGTKHVSDTETLHAGAKRRDSFSRNTAVTDTEKAAADASPGEKPPAQSGSDPAASATQIQTPAVHPEATADLSTDRIDSGTHPTVAPAGTRVHGEASEAGKTQADIAAHQKAAVGSENPADIVASRSTETAQASQSPAPVAQAKPLASPSKRDWPQGAADGDSAPYASSPVADDSANRADTDGNAHSSPANPNPGQTISNGAADGRVTTRSQSTEPRASDVEPRESATRNIAPSTAGTAAQTRPIAAGTDEQRTSISHAAASTRQPDKAAHVDELTKYNATMESDEPVDSPAAEDSIVETMAAGTPSSSRRAPVTKGATTDGGESADAPPLAADTGDNGNERRAGTHTTGNASTKSSSQAISSNEHRGRDGARTAAEDVSGTDAAAAKTMPVDARPHQAASSAKRLDEAPDSSTVRTSSSTHHDASVDSTASPAQHVRPQAAQGTEAKHLSGTEASQTNANDRVPFPEKTVAIAAGATSDAAPAENAPTPSGIVPTESVRRMRTPAPHPTVTADPSADAKDSGSLPNDVTTSTRAQDNTPADIGATDVTATPHESAPANRAVQSQPTTGRTERSRPPAEAVCDDKAPEANETQGDNAAQSATTRDGNPAEIDPPRSIETAHVSRSPASAAQAPISPSRHDRPQLPADGESDSDTSSPDTTQASDRAAATDAREGMSAHSASKVGTEEDASESSAAEYSLPSVSGNSADECNTALPPSTTEEGNDTEASHDSAPTDDTERWRARVMERVSGEFADAIERHGENAADRGRYYRDLLEALAADEPIDPAAIAARSVREAATVAGVPNVGPSSPDSSRSEILHDRSWIEGLLSTDSSALRLVVTPLLADPASAAEAVALWPAELLERVFARLRPAEFGTLRPYAETMTSACTWDDAATRNRRMWCFLAEALFPAPRYAAAPDFVAAYADRIAAEAPSMGDFRAALCAALPEGTNAARPTQYIRYWLLGASRTPRQTDVPVATQTGIAIDNAGLVLLSPYLPRLFDMLGLLQEGQQFSNPAQARRASHLLQFTVNERSDAAEHELALNKLLCGLDLRQPLDAGITVEEQERSAIEGMLTACIAHWGALGNASIAGLRETFLQRPGQLTFSAEAWRLKVEKKTLDILMERLPWSFSIIRHPWMTQPVFVEWL